MCAANQITEEERFYKNTLVLVDAITECSGRLQSSGYTEITPAMCASAKCLIQLKYERNMREFIETFIAASHSECWDRIKNREEEYFVQHAGKLFSALPLDKVNLFKDLFLGKDSQGRNIVPQAVKDQIWGLLDAMVKISIKYVHKGRGPYSYRTETGEMANAYSISFFDDVNVGHHCNVWNVMLEFNPRI